MIFLFSLMQQPTAQPFQAPNILDLLVNAGIVAKVVLLLLLLFSIISWAIILGKFWTFWRVRREADRFLSLFHERRGVREILQASRQYVHNPFAEVFKEAYWHFNRNDSSTTGEPVGGSIDMLREQKARPSQSSDDLVRLFDSVASREVLRLEKSLVFLATTGSVSPFFGLFGTVWGVMSAFLAIGFTGSADLSVVAPGIAEALITTVAGLAAAIPAVMAYNFFVNKLKRLSAELEIFYSNLIQAFSRKEGHEVR